MLCHRHGYNSSRELLGCPRWCCRGGQTRCRSLGIEPRASLLQKSRRGEGTAVLNLAVGRVHSRRKLLVPKLNNNISRMEQPSRFSWVTRHSIAGARIFGKGGVDRLRAVDNRTRHNATIGPAAGGSHATYAYSKRRPEDCSCETNVCLILQHNRCSSSLPTPLGCIAGHAANRQEREKRGSAASCVAFSMLVHKKAAFHTGFSVPPPLLQLRCAQLANNRRLHQRHKS